MKKKIPPKGMHQMPDGTMMKNSDMPPKDMPMKSRFVIGNPGGGDMMMGPTQIPPFPTKKKPAKKK